MPAIKLKKKTQEYLAEKEREKEKELAEQKKEAQKSPTKKRKLTEITNLDGEVLLEKRKRTIPVVEQKCADWVEDNFESKEGCVIGLPTLYKYYTEIALQDQANVVDTPIFNRIVKDKLGEHFGVKDTSPLKGILRERKPEKKKPKVQGETLRLKMKDIISEIISGVGNPLKGLQFSSLKKKIGAAYPALQIEIHPKKLLKALNHGVRFGQITLVRGTGKCGFYRIPGESTAEEDKPKPKKEKPKGEEGENEEGADEEGKEDTEEDSEAPEEGKAKKSEEGKGKKRGRKRKSEDNAKDEEGKEGDEEQKEGEEQEGEAPKPKKKKRKKGKKAKKREFYDGPTAAERHAEPTKVEDTFPMAITYMGDPKEASVTKIKFYIETHYPDVDTDMRLKKALEKGEEKGLWQRIGHSYRILSEDFNPAYSEDINDMVTQAIMATHSPKIASALYMKKYITQYHPDFQIESRPNLFKSALERAIRKGMIRQITGIGSSGSFQLVNNFNPSPAILAGETEDERAAEREAEGVVVEDDPDPESRKFKEVYIIRRTKSGRTGGIKPSMNFSNVSSKGKREKEGVLKPEGMQDDKYAEVYIVRKTKSGRLGGKKSDGGTMVSSTSSFKRR
ncbi:hypothetical protein FSP39_025397 [Pinctada imbricata]|uniref:H15 domain-containing protein n=1 Tax=Pinctada imbricata TaxID=66713 RepID=A0AA89BQY2_PINIB|nr:hypothetical protein FSP39_025397 [Pinctada imbricata]